MMSLHPTTSLSDLRAKLEGLHERERELLDKLGRAYLRGDLGETLTRELAQIREELEAAHAARRVFRLTPPEVDLPR